MHARGARLDRGQAVGDVEPAVAVAVPVDAHAVRDAELDQELAHPGDEVAHALRDGRAAPCRRGTRAWRPHSIAAVSSSRRSSGVSAIVSSVTYMTSRPSAHGEARSPPRVCRRMTVRSHSSAYWRIGLLPMKMQASIGTPVRCDDVGDRLDVGDHACGRRSWPGCAAAWSAISRHSRSTASRWRGPAPGRPMSARVDAEARPSGGGSRPSPRPADR